MGNVQKQDFMLFVSDTVATSFLNTVISNDGLDITKMLKDSFFDKQLNYSDVAWLNPIIAGSASNPNTTVDLSVKLDKVYYLKFLNNNIEANGTLTFTFKNDKGELLSTYRINDLFMSVDVLNRPRYAQVYGQVKNIAFKNTEVLRQGKVYLDKRGLIRDESMEANNFAEWI